MEHSNKVRSYIIAYCANKYRKDDNSNKHNAELQRADPCTKDMDILKITKVI